MHTLLRALVLLATMGDVIPNVLLAQFTSSVSSLPFGDRQVGSLSPGQTIFLNPSSYTDTFVFTLSGTDAEDFIQRAMCWIRLSPK
jgi:hypothetical protein